MAFIPVPLTAQVATRFLWDSQEVANVYHVTNPGGWDGGTLTDVASIFANWWDVELQPGIASSCSLVEVAATDISVAGGRGVLYTTGLPLVGGSADPSLPNSVTVAVKWATGFTGRSYRGRTYHIGLVEPQVTNNTVVSGYVTTLTAAYNALRTSLAAEGYTLVVASRYADKAPREEGITTPITAASVNPIVDVQRRRLPGRGQ